MPFKKGASGNPGGRPQSLPWKSALGMALTSKSGKPLAEALADVAGVVVDGALRGDFACIKEIGDRLDGKPTAQVSLQHEITTPSETIAASISDVRMWLSSLQNEKGKELGSSKSCAQ